MTPILRASVVAFLVLATCISHGQDTRVRTIPTDSLPDQTAVLPLEVVPGKTAVVFESQTETGEWVVTTAILPEIERPFYTKPWFYVFLIVLVALGLYFTFRFLINKSRKNAITAQKVAQLERSALQAQMNPHFIFNSLNSIQSYIALNENDKANRFLAKFARLIRVMLNNSRSTKVTLQEEVDSLRLYLELEKMRFKEKFDFDIILDEDIDPLDIELPPLLIQPYLENAIIHGLAQKRSQGKINLYYILQGKYLMATVTDNGIGIEQSKKQKTGAKSLHKSVGMTLTQKRLEMLDDGNKDRKVKIEEIKDRTGEVLGTKVEVKIRVK